MNHDFIEYLKNEFAGRCGRNPLYSLRKFAMDLGVKSGPLSAMFSGKRSLTLKTFETIVPRLRLAKDQEEKYRQWVINTLEGRATFIHKDKITSHFVLIVLEILKLEGHPKTLTAIAKSARLDEQACAELLRQMKEEKLVECSDNKYRAVVKNPYFKFDVKMVREMFEHATQAVECYDTSRRLHFCSYMAIGQDDVNEIKELLRKKCSEIIHWNGQREAKEEIYQLAISFNPVD